MARILVLHHCSLFPPRSCPASRYPYPGFSLHVLPAGRTPRSQDTQFALPCMRASIASDTRTATSCLESIAGSRNNPRISVNSGLFQRRNHSSLRHWFQRQLLISLSHGSTESANPANRSPICLIIWASEVESQGASSCISAVSAGLAANAPESADSF